MLLLLLLLFAQLFERMNMLKKAYYASDASLPLKTQLELFMAEDVPETNYPGTRKGGN